ncbi:MAG: adenylate/guanylate cyclase domain-containing protein, partial [Myxococcales bacterium]|nr:adenylate/guanylate cyclase domain-containing protein [Myxococcales bacterium]
RVDPDALRDKIVLVGVSYLGKDRVRTPYGPGAPGVELHATVLDQLLRGDGLRRVSPLRDALGCLVAGLLVAGLFAPRLRFSPALRVLGVLTAACLYVYVAYALFAQGGRWAALVWPLLTVATVGTCGLTLSYFREALGRRQLRRSFANYLGDDALRELLADPRALQLGGARRPISILFSDIRGFTELSERLSPEQLVTVLNTFLTPMTREVLARGGYLDKYIGDAVMAVFGAPVAHEDHVRRCLETAIAMVGALRELQPQFGEQGLEVAMGVGVNTGDAVVGNMGSAERFDYTAVGDAVNLASRLEGLTKVYGVRVLVGDQTRAAAGPEFRFREVDLVRVKGKGVPVAIHELLSGPGGEIAAYDGIEVFERALADYRAGELAAARAGFDAFAARNPGERCAALYQERLRALGERAPAGWDGIASFTSK